MSKSKRDTLIAEFMEQQLWQFISIDEWLQANQDQQDAAISENAANAPCPRERCPGKLMCDEENCPLASSGVDREHASPVSGAGQ